MTFICAENRQLQFIELIATYLGADRCMGQFDSSAVCTAQELCFDRHHHRLIPPPLQPDTSWFYQAYRQTVQNKKREINNSFFPVQTLF
jgi:hypothetical protein